MMTWLCHLAGDTIIMIVVRVTSHCWRYVAVIFKTTWHDIAADMTTLTVTCHDIADDMMLSVCHDTADDMTLTVTQHCQYITSNITLPVPWHCHWLNPASDKSLNLVLTGNKGACHHSDWRQWWAASVWPFHLPNIHTRGMSISSVCVCFHQ